MSNKIVKPLSIAVGVAFVGSLAISQAATAASFSLSDLGQGYQLAGDPADKAKEEGKCGEGKCGEGKCGAEKAKEEGKCGEGKCGEGKCGMDKLDANKDGSLSAAEFSASGHPAEKFAKIDADNNGAVTQAEMDAHHKAMEGKCGEGKCGEGKCGGEKAKQEGKCGEGKCGGDKEKKEGSCGGSR